MLRVTKMWELQAILVLIKVLWESYVSQVIYGPVQPHVGAPRVFTSRHSPSGQSLVLEPLFRCCIVENEEQGNPKRKQK